MPSDLSTRGRVARLGDILLEERIITPSQLEEGLARKKAAGGFLGQALVDLGHIDQETLTLVLVKQCKIPHLNLHEYSIGDDMLSLMPAELCAKYNVLPVDKMGKILTVAMVDPLDVDALAAVRAKFPDLRIKPILCDWPHFQEVFERMTAKKPAAPAPVVPVVAVALDEPCVVELDETPAEIPVAVAEPMEPDPALAVSPRRAAAGALDGAAITAAIRDGVRDTLGHFEAKLAEASELLKAIQRAEREVVAAQSRRDLGVPSGAPSANAPLSLAELEAAAPRPAYSFQNFIAGPANRAVLELAKSVARGASVQLNPLFICGEVGLGKTHLISAIGNAMLARNPAPIIGWISAGRFAELACAWDEQGRSEEFRRACSRWQALILDDIQFLGGKVEAQEELFHVFNALHERGCPIVIAGDRMPEKLGLLEQRLVSRFDGGQAVRIAAPEWDTRMAILKLHARQLNVPAPDDVMAMLAMRFPADVRRLIGALRKVAARAGLQGGAMSAALASEVLAESGAGAAA